MLPNLPGSSVYLKIYIVLRHLIIIMPSSIAISYIALNIYTIIEFLRKLANPLLPRLVAAFYKMT